MSRRKAWGVVTVSTLAAVFGTVGVAQASPLEEFAGPEPGMATFEGKLIDLRKSWGEARVCDVYSVRDVRCFRTADQAADGRGGPALAAATGIEDCPDGWLCIWAGGNHSGNMAKTQDEREGLIKLGKSQPLGDTPLWSRVNSLDSPWFFDDVTQLVAEIGNQLEVLMIPKVTGAWDRPQYILQAQLAEPIISLTLMPREAGKPWPPYGVGMLRACQPSTPYC